MTSFIISLDSLYRDALLYPNPGAYDIIINPFTPGSSNYQSSANTTYSIDNPVFTSFQWVGNTTFPTSTILGYPISIPCNARGGRSSQFFALNIFRLDDTDQVKTVDYYVGCILFLFVPTDKNQDPPSDVPVDEFDYQTGIISLYDPVKNQISLQTGMNLTFLTRVFQATQNNPTFNNYYIINTSFTQKNNLILLGINSFLSESDQNYLSDIAFQKVPTTDMWVQNVSKGWITSMYYIDTTNRNAFLTPTDNQDFTLDLNDVFILRANDNVFSVQTIDNLIASVLQDARITHPGALYLVGNVYNVYTVQDTGALVNTGLSLRVTQINPTGGIKAYSWTSPLTSTSTGTVLQVGGSGMQDPAILTVVSVGYVAIPISVHDGMLIDNFAKHTLFSVYVPVQGQSILQSFAKYDRIVYTENTAYLCINQYTGSTTVPVGTFVQLISYSPHLTGVVAPVIGYQQGVCYRIRLLSLVLPNQPINGINQLPSFFPYFMLQLYNTNMNTGSTNIMYTNHPYTQKVTFFCPMANPRNQLVASYVVVRSTQENFIKWTSIGSLHVEILLPDGTPLVYAETAKIAKIVLEKQTKGLSYQSFIISLMNQVFEPHIVATFEFQIMT